jgi:hypothetical protein
MRASSSSSLSTSMELIVSGFVAFILPLLYGRSAVEFDAFWGCGGLAITFVTIALGYALSMTNKRLRAIAALEVELTMTEAHAKRLSTATPNSTDPEQEHALAALVKEENDRAEMLRRQIHLLKGHV